MLMGRQGLHIIYSFFVTDQQASQVHALEDLLSVTFHGDPKLETFISNWDSVLIGMDAVPNIGTLYTLFFRQIKDSRVLSFDLQVMERWTNERKVADGYEHIRNAIFRYLNTQRQDLVRKQMKAAIKGGQAAPAPKGKGPQQKPQAAAPAGKHKPKAKAHMGTGTAKKDKPCFRERDNGTCDIPGCEYKHGKPTMAAPPNRGRSKGGGKGGKAKPRSPSPKGSKKPCTFYPKGTCKYGKECQYYHRKSQSPSGGKGNNKARSQSPKRKSKGKGKGRT